MLQTLLKFRNADSTLDLNTQLAGFFDKGFVSGGDILPVANSLSVQVTPFKLIGEDGMVVLETSNTQTLTVQANETNVIIFQSQYVSGGTPVAQYLVMALSAFQIDPAAATYCVFGTVTVPSGATQTDVTQISYAMRDEIDPVSRLTLRGTQTSSSNLPASNNLPGDAWTVTSGQGDTPAFYIWNGVNWLNVTDSLVVASLLSAHRNNLFTNEIHLTDDQAQAVLGTYGNPGTGNAFVTSTDPRMATQDQANALVGLPTGNPDIPPSATNPFVTSAFPIGQPAVLNFSSFPGPSLVIGAGQGPVYVGQGSGTAALANFKLYHATAPREYLNFENSPVTITGIFKDFALTLPLVPSSESTVLADDGFWTGALYLTTSAQIDVALRLVYLQKETLAEIDKGILGLVNPNSAQTSQETLLKLQAISGREMDDTIPTNEQNINLRLDITDIQQYLTATTASDLVIDSLEFPRLREYPTLISSEFPQELDLNILLNNAPFAVATGTAAIQTFDSYYSSHAMDASVVAIINYSTAVSLSSVLPGHKFQDGAGTLFRILAVSTTGNGSLMVYTGNKTVSATVTSTSGQIITNSNPRDLEIIADHRTSLHREFIPIEGLSEVLTKVEALPPGGSSVGTGSLFSLIGQSLLPNQGNSGGIPSGRSIYNVIPQEQGNRIDPRVILIGNWKQDSTNSPNQVLGQVSQGGLGIEYTGRLTDLILLTSVNPNMPCGFQVFIDGAYNSAASQFLSGPNLAGLVPSAIIQNLRGSTEAILQPIFFPLGLSGTQIHTVRIELTLSGTDSFPLYGLEVYYGNGLMEEAGSAFLQAQLVQTAGTVTPANPIVNNTIRGTKVTRYLDRATEEVLSAQISSTSITESGITVNPNTNQILDSAIINVQGAPGDVYLLSTHGTFQDNSQMIYVGVESIDVSAGTINLDRNVPFTMSNNPPQDSRAELVFRIPVSPATGLPTPQAVSTSDEVEYARFQTADWSVGSPNDVALLSDDSAQNLVTVLDDGMTALLVNNCQLVDSGVEGYTQAIQLNSTSSFVTCTAWGTRQDFIFVGNQGPVTITIEIDGQYSYNVTLSGSGVERHSCFYEGAPQSHTVRIMSPTQGNRVQIGAIGLFDLAPVVVDGVPLSEYTILRNRNAANPFFDATYSQLNNPCIVSYAGVRVVDLTKANARYYDGTSGATPWRIIQDFTNNPRFGYYSETNKSQARIDLSITGTAVEIYFDANTDKGQALVYINDVLATLGNFPSLKYSSNYNDNTATLEMYAASQTKSRLVLAGLPFGRYKVSVVNTGNMNVLSTNTFMRFFAYSENSGLGSIQKRSWDDTATNRFHYGSFKDLRPFVTLLPEQVGLVQSTGSSASTGSGGITTIPIAESGRVDLETEPFWFGTYVDWKNDASAPNAPDSPCYTVDGYTNSSTYSKSPGGLILNYDATLQYSGSGTTVNLTNVPTWVQQPKDLDGCVFYPFGPSNSTVCRIVQGVTTTQVILDQPITTVSSIATEGCGVYDTLHTKDLVQFKPGISGDNQSVADRLPIPVPAAISNVILKDVDTIKFEAEGSVVAGGAGKDALWNGTSLFAYQMNREGLRAVGTTPDTTVLNYWSQVYTTNGLEEQDVPVVGAPGGTDNERLFLRIFPAFTSGAGFVNLLNFSALFFEVQDMSPNPTTGRFAHGYTDNSAASVNCTISVNGSGKTQITLPQPYNFNANPNTTQAEFRFLLGGREIFSAGAVGVVFTDAYFTQLDAYNIQLDSNYSGVSESIDLIWPQKTPSVLKVSTLAPMTWTLSGTAAVSGSPFDCIRTALDPRTFTQLKFSALLTGNVGNTTVVNVLRNSIQVATTTLTGTSAQGAVTVPVSIVGSPGDQFQVQLASVGYNVKDITVELG
jgi:hypothetical protein